MISFLLLSCGSPLVPEIASVRSYEICHDYGHGHPLFSCAFVDTPSGDQGLVIDCAGKTCPSLLPGDFFTYVRTPNTVDRTMLDDPFRGQGMDVRVLQIHSEASQSRPAEAHRQCAAHPSSEIVGPGRCVGVYVIYQTYCAFENGFSTCTQARLEDHPGEQITLVSDTRPQFGVGDFAMVLLGSSAPELNRQREFQGEWVAPWPNPYRVVAP